MATRLRASEAPADCGKTELDRHQTARIRNRPAPTLFGLKTYQRVGGTPREEVGFENR